METNNNIYLLIFEIYLALFLLKANFKGGPAYCNESVLFLLIKGFLIHIKNINRICIFFFFGGEIKYKIQERAIQLFFYKQYIAHNEKN